MKKFLLFAAIMFSSCAGAQQTINLPAPTKSSTMTLTQALEQRHSDRNFSDREISDQTLSDLLWMACGVNRAEEGKLTVPSARNMQDVKVYILRKDGIWLYDAHANNMVKISDVDLRNAAGTPQASVKEAPLFLLLVSDQRTQERANEKWGWIDAGYVSQNICLACTTLGLSTVPRAYMDNKTITETLKLTEGQFLILNHPIGYPK